MKVGGYNKLVPSCYAVVTSCYKYCCNIGYSLVTSCYSLVTKKLKLKAALAFFYCAYYPRIFSSMFCGEITTNRRQLYRFRVFKIAELETVRPDVSGVNLRNMAAKRTILGPILLEISSYNNASAAEMIGPEMSVSDILRNVYIDRINNVNVKN